MSSQRDRQHDYHSGAIAIGAEKRPAAPAARRVGAEVKTLILQVGAGNFKWVDAYSCDSAGNKKTVFVPGEAVQLYMKMRNDGNVAAAARIKVIDDATGDELWATATMYIDPGASMEIKPPVTGLALKMPTANWTLRLEISP